MADEDETQNDDGKGGDAFTPITTQDELNAVIKDRIARERAKFADYNDLKTKAARLDTLEKANQTEAQKSAERLATLERELETTRTDALRAKVQAKFSISDEDAELFLTATDADTLTKQAERLAAHNAETKRSGGRAPLQGRSPSPANGKDGDEREFVTNLFGGGD